MNQESRKEGKVERWPRRLSNALSQALAIGLGTSRSTFYFPD